MKPRYQLSPSHISRFGLAVIPALVCSAIAVPTQLQSAIAQAPKENRPLTIRSDVQEYDSKTQVVTARGNVQLSYPARQIQATAAQAQFFNKERRIIMSGNVYILQQDGSSIRGETVTYLIDEGRFIAQPKANRQVETTYIVNDTPNQAKAPAPKTPALKRTN
ncbi:LptA/OstA family protein [Iningainema tapete]|uniref:OstA family protein n=1 Tax=Iningainema tapete BLCC-T55 TaxID=2748662 RepID=A0A8J7C5G6_9CYAN|nr:LptA/OstA family protein [Iningainema tapete]MBD2773114.1 OstA family protein [Iningainema tapete BLCC-T55]